MGVLHAFMTLQMRKSAPHLGLIPCTLFISCSRIAFTHMGSSNTPLVPRCFPIFPYDFTTRSVSIKQNDGDCYTKTYRLRSKVVEIVALFSSNLKAFTPMNNEQPKPNPSSVACGWRESKWLQGRFIHSVRGQERALCSLFQNADVAK